MKTSLQQIREFLKYIYSIKNINHQKKKNEKLNVSKYLL